AERGALGDHPADRRAARLVHRLDQRPERAVAALARYLGSPGGAPAPVIAAPCPWAAVAAGVADVVDPGAKHLADGLEAYRADGGELIGRERRSPGTAAPDLGHAGFRGRWQVVAHNDYISLAQRVLPAWIPHRRHPRGRPRRRAVPSPACPTPRCAP